MALTLQTITEQYAQMYQNSDFPETKSVTMPPKPKSGLKSNPSGLSISLVRKLSSAVSAKPPQTPAAGARGATCDLLDANFMALDVDTAWKAMEDMNVRVADNIFKDYGGKIRFSGTAVTIQCLETNQILRNTLDEPGEGRVLVVDGQESKRCALLGDILAAKMHRNGFSGIIINGCVRDTEDISKIPIGVKALGTCPVKPGKAPEGTRGEPVTFAGITINEGDWIYADADGIIVSRDELVV
ncbi:Putative 4-hydroxy-4-methyl-2-oxoglutarate aldolase at C-terminar half [Coccomyxa sp. Obi]|nr:Putative 4-hydroxy-4-methyl-2-oxoglutarate aldolase at C-terminar half [Coccomyxa sp. Obi]